MWNHMMRASAARSTPQSYVGHARSCPRSTVFVSSRMPIVRPCGPWVVERPMLKHTTLSGRPPGGDHAVLRLGARWTQMLPTASTVESYTLNNV